MRKQPALSTGACRDCETEVASLEAFHVMPGAKVGMSKQSPESQGLFWAMRSVATLTLASTLLFIEG